MLQPTRLYIYSQEKKTQQAKNVFLDLLKSTACQIQQIT